MTRRRLSNVHVLLLAVAHLGGDSRSVHTEDAAIEAFRIAPARFGWRKYPERIDLEQVRRSLTEATQKSPPLLVGSVRRGWMLSKDGIRWIEAHTDDLPEPAEHRRGSISDAIEIERFRLKETTAWRKLKAGSIDKLTLNDLFEFARINEYFSDAKRHERFNIISTAVEGDAELTSLWQLLQQHFPDGMEAVNG